MEQVSLRIDDQDILAHKGATILEAALANKIYVPHLCYHPDLKPAGSCRLCVVEMEDGKLVSSCRTPVNEGMVVKTKSQEVDKVRRPIVEMLIANHHMDCRNCPKKGRCELQRIRAYTRIDKKGLQRLRLPKEELPLDVSNPFFERNPNKCVLCGICVRTCQEIQRVSAIDFASRGYTTKIATLGDKPIAQSKCESCGECVIRCPVGALVPKSLRRPSHEVKTICPYCGVGCGIFLGIRDNVVVNVRGDGDSPVNRGNLCVKGRFGLSFVNSPERLTVPLIRKSRNNPPESPLTPLWKRDNPPQSPFSKGGFKGDYRGGQGWGEFREASWDEAIEFVANKLSNYKGEEFALLASTKCTNEDNYIAQKFARVVMNSNNIDSSVRLSHAPSIVAMLEASAPPFSSPFSKGRYRGVKGEQIGSLSEIEQAACILAIGTNVTRSHPVAGLRIKKAVENSARLIVINPKEINLCSYAEIWLRPYPGTDVALLMGMSKVIVDEGLLDNAFVEEWGDNFEDFKNSLDDFPLGRVERITGVSRDMVAKAARVYATSKPGTILWSTGITQYSHGTENVLSLVNLVILTGNIGKPSSGLTPLLGQNNAQGVCDMGCLPDFYPGYEAVASPVVRKKFESFWGKSLNPEPGLTFTEVLQATHERKVKALYVIGSDPASSIAPAEKVKEALKVAEFVVLQDIFLNETSKFAHVILPATSFAEKDGTFTNMEGRVQRVLKAIEPLGNSRPDWQIICDLARKLGSKGFDFRNPEEIMSEISSGVSIYKRISYEMLEKSSLPLSYLEEKDFHADKIRFRFTSLEYKPQAEGSDIEYPLILITERDIYSGGFLSQKVEGLKILRSEGIVYINPKDAIDFGIKDSEMVRIISRWGETEGKAKVMDSSPPGIVTMSLDEKAIDMLINPSHEMIAKALETKVCAIKIAPQQEYRDE